MEQQSRNFASSGWSTSNYRLGVWAGTGLMVSAMLTISPAAQAETLAAWQFDPTTQQLTVTLPSGVIPQYWVETDPARIVLTIPQTQLGSVTTQQAYGGAVSQVSLSQVNADTVVVLELSPETILAEEGASLVAIAPEGGTGDQTRWVLTALVDAPGSTLATLPPTPGTASMSSTSGMIVELPVIPSNDPRLGFPAAGTGQLSTSAANLMLPSDVDSLTNLPDTLPVDPFNLGIPGEQVSVPSLDELDAIVGPVATNAPVAAVPSVAAEPDAIAPLPPVAPPRGTSATVTLEPPPLPGEPSRAAQPTAIATAPPATADPPAVQPLVAGPSAAEPPTTEPTATEPLAPIDAETTGTPIVVVPPELPTPAAPAVSAPISTPETPASQAAAPGTPAAETLPSALPAPVLPIIDASAIAVEPPTPPPSAPAADSAPALPVLTEPSSEGAIAALTQDPPPVATVPVTGTDPNLLVMPTAPTTATQGTVIPPAEPVMLAAAGQPILFGSPLPSNGLQAANPSAIDPAPTERPISPDTLVAAGTVLELRYVGDEPLDLNINASQNQVLVLAQDIRDPITNGVVAPAGSQLIGQFEPSANGQQWVSTMLIAPAGQQVAFSSTSDYLLGNTQVSPPRVAAGAGVGALALLLLTGWSGVGLVGGALLGATTMVGTSPQHLVIEPNQVMQVQVIQDVPRSMPIASASEYSREWGMGGW